MRITTLVSITALAFAGCDDRPYAPTSPSPPPTVPPVMAAPEPPPAGPLPVRYALTLSVGRDCAVVPEGDRTRRYTATFERGSSANDLVTLSDAPFLSGTICTAGSGRFSNVGCNQFFAAEDRDTVHFSLENNNDEAHGGHIVERLPSGGWWEVIGSASGRRTATAIEASGTASIWYCPTSLGYPFPCFAWTSCRTTELRLTFTAQ